MTTPDKELREAICIQCKKLLPIDRFYKRADTVSGHRVKCISCLYQDSHKYLLQHPWLRNYAGARDRCLNKKCCNYHRYGGRGIKFLLIPDKVKELWFRDKAYLLKSPSLDRINNNGNYEFSNCRFIERIKNSSLGNKGKKISEATKAKRLKTFLRLLPTYKIKRGVDSWKAKLSEEDVKLIRADKTSSKAELGRKYKVSGVAIHRIKTRQTWKHI